MNKELSMMNIKGEDYVIVDKASREAIGLLKTNIQGLATTLDVYKTSILEIAQQLTNLKQDEVAKRTTATLENTNLLPVLKFDGNFSILVDITINKGNKIYSNQQIIKCYNKNTYHKIIDENQKIDCYIQFQNDEIYLFFDSSLDDFTLNFNVISYDGDYPKIIFNKTKFSTDIYSNALKLK